MLPDDWENWGDFDNDDDDYQSLYDFWYPFWVRLDWVCRIKKGAKRKRHSSFGRRPRKFRRPSLNRSRKISHMWDGQNATDKVKYQKWFNWLAFGDRIPPY